MGPQMVQDGDSNTPMGSRCRMNPMPVRMGTEVPLRGSGAQNGDQFALMVLRCLKGGQEVPNMGLG